MARLPGFGGAICAHFDGPSAVFDSQLVLQTREYAEKRGIEKRREKFPRTGGDRPMLPNSAHSLVKTYHREFARRDKLMLTADHAHQQLFLVVQGLRRLFADEHSVTLLRAEGLDSLPKYLADRIETA